MDSNKNLYNAMEAVERIYGYKNQWHSADKSGDKAKADEVAKKAQVYYKMLRDSGYADVADALTNTNDIGAKYIYENFMKNNSAPTTPTAPTGKAPTVENTTGVPTVKSDMPKAVDTTTITGKINDLYGIQRSDRETMAGKYDTLEDYNYNHNPYESEIGKSIMEDYKFKGKTASDNAVASDAGTNGGNIDSYASANANRQQLAFTNAGKKAVLEDFDKRIQNARNILNDLGVYQQNQDKGMQTTIEQHQTEEQRTFENDETKKNNQVDRDVKVSEVTGYVPESMDYSNNPFFNKDGTLINPETTDYSQIITNARNKLKTTTDSAEKANLEATIKYATQARAYKILNVDGYSQWADTMELTSPNETLTSKLANKEIDTEKAIEDSKLATEAELTKAELEATERMNNANNATELEKARLSSTEEEAEITWEDALKAGEFSKDAEDFLNSFAKPFYDENEEFNVREALNVYKYDESSGKGYKITRNDARRIGLMYGVNDTIMKWIEDQTWYGDKKDEDPEYTPE